MRKTLLAALMTSLVLPVAAQAQEFRGGRGGGERGGFNRAERPERPERPDRADRPTPAPAPAPNEGQRRQWTGGDRDAWRAQRGGGGGDFQRPAPAQPVQAAPAPIQPQQRWQGGERGDARRDWRSSNRAERPNDRDWQSDRFQNRRDDRNWQPDRFQNRADDRNWQSDRFRNRNDSRGWQSDRRWTGNGNWNRDRDWNRNWRQDNRYDWRGYRNYNRNAFRLPRYYAPYGWDQGYRRFGIGAFLDGALFGQNYWIGDPGDYRLPPVDWPFQWVRYYNDALLVDTETGEVVDVIEGIFW